MKKNSFDRFKSEGYLGENIEFIPLPTQPVDLTEIRAKLWADVYSNAGIVLGLSPQEQADEAIKAFDERFKNKAL